MRRTERAVFAYDVIVGARAAHAVPPSLDEIVAVMEALFSDPECVNTRDRGNLIFRIGEIVFDNQRSLCTILFRRADKNAADAVYSNIVNGQTRVAPKSQDEAGDTAAHLTLSLQPERGKPNTYFALLEGVPGVSHRHVQALINEVLRLARKKIPLQFTYPDPAGARDRSGAPKLHEFTPLLEMRGHISDSLTADLEAGIVEQLEIVRADGHTNFAGSPFLKEDRYSLKIKADRNIPALGRFDWLVNAMRTRRTDFDKGRIAFKDTDGRRHTIECDLQTGALFDQKYIKSFLIRPIDPPLNQSSETVVPALARRMEAILRHERNV